MSESEVRKIGIFADPQVRVAPARLVDEPQWSGSTRYYSAVFGHVQTAVREFRRHQVSWVLQLGDLVDNANSKEDPPCSQDALLAIEEELKFCHEDGLDRVHHLVGNNDIQNFSRHDWSTYEWARRARRTVAKDLEEEGAYTHYYDFKPFEDLQWRCVLLDSFVVSIMPKASNNEGEAKAMLSSPEGSVGCVDLAADAPTDEYRKSLSGERYNELAVDDPRRRFTQSSGGFGIDQLKWLRSVLDAAKERRELVILFGHTPIHPKVANDLDALAYDYDKLLGLLKEYQAHIVAYIAGHDHIGGYTHDEGTNIHHLTLASPLEAEMGTGSRFLVLDFNKDRVLLKGAMSVPENPIPRAFVSTASQLPKGHGEDLDGKRRMLEAQTRNRYINFATHWGVVWPAKCA